MVVLVLLLIIYLMFFVILFFSMILVISVLVIIVKFLCDFIGLRYLWFVELCILFLMVICIGLKFFCCLLL